MMHNRGMAQDMIFDRVELAQLHEYSWPSGSYHPFFGHHIQQSMDQPGKVANPARGQLNRKTIFPCPRSRLGIWSHANIRKSIQHNKNGAINSQTPGLSVSIFLDHVFSVP